MTKNKIAIALVLALSASAASAKADRHHGRYFDYSPGGYSGIRSSVDPAPSGAFGVPWGYDPSIATQR